MAHQYAHLGLGRRGLCGFAVRRVVRYLFVSTRPNSEFAISFDLDVLKVYGDYDKVERNYFNKPENPIKLMKWEKEARIYELSQAGGGCSRCTSLPDSDSSSDSSAPDSLQGD